MSTNWRLLIEQDIVPTLLVMAGVVLCGFLLSFLRATIGARSEPLRYFVLFDVVVAIGAALLSGRDLTLERPLPLSAAHIHFTQAVTVLLLILACERAFRFFVLGEFRRVHQGILLGVVMIFFLTMNFLAPILGRNPEFSNKLFYSPILMFALIALAMSHLHDFLVISRNTLIAYLAIGMVFMIVAPNMVMDSSYREGFIPGMNIRYYGFATHPNSLAVYAFVLMCLLWLRPIGNGRVALSAWALAWVSLLLTQSKTSLFFAVVSVAALWIYRQRSCHRQSEPATRLRSHALIGAMASASAIGVLILAGLLTGLIDPGGIERRLDQTNFWTLTGRLRIWEVSLSDLWDNPWFGYGGDLWNREYQLVKGVFVAHAHNQYVHTLGDTGFVGLGVLLIYLSAIGIAAWRKRRETNGVGMVLAAYIVVRGITEAPLIVDSVYGPEILVHAILLMLCISSRDRVAVKRFEVAGVSAAAAVDRLKPTAPSARLR